MCNTCMFDLGGGDCWGLLGIAASGCIGRVSRMSTYSQSLWVGVGAGAREGYKSLVDIIYIGSGASFSECEIHLDLGQWDGSTSC